MFERATDADIPAIADLMNHAYRGNAGAGWRTEAAYLAGDRTTPALLRSDLAKRPTAAMLLWRDGAGGGPAGCIWLEPLDGGTWYLGSLTVDPARQAGGLGRTMLAAAEDRARAGGATRIRMTVVNVRETLIAWYGRCGYRPTGGTEPFPYGDDRHGRPLRDDLCFVVLEKVLAAAT